MCKLIIFIFNTSNYRFIVRYHVWRRICRFYILPLWSLDLFIRVPLQPRVVHAVPHIAISVLPGRPNDLHLSQVKHVGVKCLAQGHKHRNNFLTLRGGKHDIYQKSWVWNRTSGSDNYKAPRSNHCATSHRLMLSVQTKLSIKHCVQAHYVTFVIMFLSIMIDTRGPETTNRLWSDW